MPARLKTQLTEVEEQELSKLTRHPKIPESRFECQRMESSRNYRLAQTITKYNLEKQFLDGFFKAEKGCISVWRKYSKHDKSKITLLKKGEVT